MDAVIRKQLKIKACKARMGIIEGVFNAKSGHPGGSLSCADVLTYLYFNHMNVDPQNPKDENRDRFVLSKGHAAPALYSVSCCLKALESLLEILTNCSLLLF